MKQKSVTLRKLETILLAGHSAMIANVTVQEYGHPDRWDDGRPRGNYCARSRQENLIQANVASLAVSAVSTAPTVAPSWGIRPRVVGGG